MARGFTEYIKRANVERKAVEALDTDLKKIAAMTESTIKNRTPVRKGRLKNSMTARQTGFLQYEVATAVKYAPYVEYGTVHMAPRGMMRKGARDIAKRGTKLLTNTKKFLP